MARFIVRKNKLDVLELIQSAWKNISYELFDSKEIKKNHFDQGGSTTWLYPLFKDFFFFLIYRTKLIYEKKRKTIDNHETKKKKQINNEYV